jgi:predicted O-methyltransferase YrrM
MAKLERTVPLLTEPARQFLDAFIHPAMNVLEFGAGGSTVWFSRRCRLTTIEPSPEWMDEVRRFVNPERWTAVLADRPYYEDAHSFGDPDSFDLVLVDGRDRVECCRVSIPLIKPGGILMLDNSERERYAEVGDVLCKDWNVSVGTQRRPDDHGFTYGHWVTSWWQKP